MDVYTEIEIEASTAEVWQVLTDFPGYADWNPVIRRIRGRAQVGQKIVLGLAAGPVTLRIDAEVVIADPERELRWVGPAFAPMRRIASGSHYFQLTPLGDASCRLIHGEQFSGLLVPTQLPPVENRIQRMYEGLNRALARRAERSW